MMAAGAHSQFDYWIAERATLTFMRKRMWHIVRLIGERTHRLSAAGGMDMQSRIPFRLPRMHRLRWHLVCIN